MSGRKYISDAILFQSTGKTESGDLLITAQLKKFGETNLNGEMYAADAYDDFINDYYVKNGYEIPLTLQHGQRVEDICGKLTKIEKTDDGLFIEAVVLSALPNFNIVSTLLENGILSGVSDEGLAMGDFDSKNEVFNVKKAQILAVSIVTTPAEPLAKADCRKVENLVAAGFQDSRTGINKLLKKR